MNDLVSWDVSFGKRTQKHNLGGTSNPMASQMSDCFPVWGVVNKILLLYFIARTPKIYGGESGMLEVNHIVAHKLFKEQQSEQIDEKFADELIENNQAADTFVSNFKKAHNIRAGILHGRFIEDMNVYPAQKFIREYVEASSPEKFLEMSVSLGVHLRNCLKQ